MASGCYWLFTDSVLGGRGRIRFRKQGMRSGGVWQTDNATSHFSWSLTCWVLNTAPLKRHTANLLEVDGISVQSFCWRSLFTWMGLFIDFPELHGITQLHMMGVRIAVTSSSCLTVRSSCMRINPSSPAGRRSCVEEQAPALPRWTRFVLFGAVKWPSSPSCFDGDMVLHIKGPRAHFTLRTLCSMNV